MAWSLGFVQDTEVSGVGTATATFTNDGGMVLVSHSGRIDNRDGATIGGFIDEALAKFEKSQKINTDNDAILAKILTVLTEKTK